MDPSGKQAGATLIELVITIVILSIGLTAVLGVYTAVVDRSADPALRQQAVAIAEAYMDEAFSRPVADTGAASCSDPRELWDRVELYDCIDDEQPRDVLGETLPGLDAYRVDVDVDDVGDDRRHVRIRVRHTSGVADLRLESHRAAY